MTINALSLPRISSYNSAAYEKNCHTIKRSQELEENSLLGQANNKITFNEAISGSLKDLLNKSGENSSLSRSLQSK
jgi:hypothetical protein